MESKFEIKNYHKGYYGIVDFSLNECNGKIIKLNIHIEDRLVGKDFGLFHIYEKNFPFFYFTDYFYHNCWGPRLNEILHKLNFSHEQIKWYSSMDFYDKFDREFITKEIFRVIKDNNDLTVMVTSCENKLIPEKTDIKFDKIKYYADSFKIWGRYINYNDYYYREKIITNKWAKLLNKILGLKIREQKIKKIYIY